MEYRKRNTFLVLKKLRSNNVGIFYANYGLKDAISQQNGNAIHNRITPPAALAQDGRFLKSQGLVADGADDPAQILFRQ
jgi:hypothetical protein